MEKDVEIEKIETILVYTNRSGVVIFHHTIEENPNIYILVIY